MFPQIRKQTHELVERRAWNTVKAGALPVNDGEAKFVVI